MVKIVGIVDTGVACRICEDDEFGDTICASCVEKIGLERWED